MTPYYQDELVTLYNADCREVLPELSRDLVVVTDPPYGIGFSGYKSHKDTPGDEYVALIRSLSDFPRVVLQYPEECMRYLVPLWGAPDEVFAWCYNSNTARQFRLFCSWGVTMDFELVKQPAKNQGDPRVRDLVRSYDWTTDYQQVKNNSKEKLDHPCQIPVQLMQRVLGFLGPRQVLDPFAGSGSTLLAAKRGGVKSVGIEIDPHYCEQAVEVLRQGRLL